MLRNIWLCAVALASMVIFAGCKTAPQPVQKSDSASDIRATTALREQFAAAYNFHNAAAAIACFADDAILMHPHQEAIEGKQAVQARLEAYFKENSATITHTPLETQVAGDWAYARGKMGT